MFIKRKIESMLHRSPRFFRLGSRVYHYLRPGFKALDPGTPKAINKAFKIFKELNNGGPVGDYYEFGLHKGYTFFTAYHAAKRLGFKSMRFFGFDSFQGLPAVDGIDKTGGRFFEGQFAYSRSRVEKNLRRHGVDFEKIKLIEGFYEDVLVNELKTELKARPASIILFDCDLYSSTRTALDWMEDLIQDKTIVLFDDWHSFTEGGELGQQMALKEFKQKNRHLEFEPVDKFARYGKIFIVREH